MIPRKHIIIPDWISAIATLIIAIMSILGAIKITDILFSSRAKAIENHLTWIEVVPVDFFTRGEIDPKDPSSTFWYLQIKVQNLGKKTAYVHIKDWSFKSDKRGEIKKEHYTGGDKEFSIIPGEKISWRSSFVMNSDYHIPPLISGEDRLTVKFVFTSKDMAGVEECEYQATWNYTKGSFLLLEDNRKYYVTDKIKTFPDAYLYHYIKDNLSQFEKTQYYKEGNNMTIFNWLYLALSFLISIFYGLFAVSIFIGKEHLKTLTLTKKIREIIFNFLGAFIGFSALYYLFRKGMFSIVERQYSLVGISDILLLIIAIMGVSGYIPWAIYSISHKIADILTTQKK